MREKRISLILRSLRILENVYLLTFLFIIYARAFPQESLMPFTEMWIIASYMILPLLLLKNLLVGVLSNRLLNKKEKIWLLVRCALYILLTIYSYPLIKTAGIIAC